MGYLAVKQLGYYIIDSQRHEWDIYLLLLVRAIRLLGEGHKEPVAATIANNEDKDDDDDDRKWR